MNRFFFLLLLFAATKAEAQTSALAIADSLYAVGNYSEAIKELEKTEPKSEAVLIKLAQAQHAKGDPGAALENYRIVLENNPDKVLTSVAYAKLLSSTGKLKEADSIFSRLTQNFPLNAGFHYQLGLVREKQKDSTAMKHFNFTILFNKTHQQALFKVAKHELSKRRLWRAAQLCEQGLETNPTNASLLSILAQAYYHQEEYQQAINQFEKLIELGAGSEFVHSKTAFSYFKLSDHEKAIAHYLRALEYNAQNFATHYSLGQIYAQMGDYENSEAHLLTAILLKDQILDAEFLSLGLTYKLSEQPKKALKYLAKALEENPDNERAMFERAIVADSYYKDLEARLNLYQQYLDKHQESGTSRLIRLAQIRVKDIKQELHLTAGNP